MRALVIDDKTRAEVDRVMCYALDKKNWYRPGIDTKIPGEGPQFVAYLNTFRCVFTITKMPDGLVVRHLSISVPSKDYPSPYAALTIAGLFGFTGWDGKTIEIPEGWLVNISEEEHCVVFGQPYTENINVLN